MIAPSITIGIDPGKNGGVAVIGSQGELILMEPMPDTPSDLLLLLSDIKTMGIMYHAYLEKVGGIPGNGATAMFSFGRGYGHIEMALLALEIPTTAVTPQMWQKQCHVGASSITKSSAAEKREHKKRLKEKAQQLYPNRAKQITMKTCDAVLIAYYGHKQR